MFVGDETGAANETADDLALPDHGTVRVVAVAGVVHVQVVPLDPVRVTHEVTYPSPSLVNAINLESRIVIDQQSHRRSMLIGPGPDDYPLRHWSGNLFAFFPTGENAVGITAATFNAGAGTHARSVTLEYYNTTGLGTFVRP